MTAICEDLTLLTPEELISSYSLSEKAEGALLESRKVISSVLKRKDPRHLLVVGPCSLSDEESSLDYGRRLSLLSEKVKDSFVVVMRAYFEKARSHLGWKGFLHDPLRDGSNLIDRGLIRVRLLLRELAELKLPLAAEIVSPSSILYFSDLLSWGCIGARTVASQVHREIASSLDFPIGFKNPIDGDVGVAISGITVASRSHSYLGIDEKGRLRKMTSRGNETAHLILRGGKKGSNYSSNSIRQTGEFLKKEKLSSGLLVDCAHDNCQKNPALQKKVFESVIDEIKKGNHSIAGLMLESFIVAGSQPPTSSTYGLSLTDPCLGWEESEELILKAHQQLRG